MRRTALVGGLLTALLSLAACGSDGDTGDSESTKTITMVTWGGNSEDAMKKVWAPPFEEETGIKVAFDGPPDTAKLQAQVDAKNVSWDVYDGNAGTVIAGCGTLFEKLPDTVDISGVDPSAHVSECGVEQMQSAYVMVYNTEMFSDDPPTSAADFFDVEKYPGKRAAFNSAFIGNIEIPLLADGVPPEEIYPADVERALDKWDTIKDDLSWYNETPQSTDLLNAGSVAMALVWSGRAYDAVKDGATYAPVWNTGYRAGDVMAIVKGSSNVEAAAEYINFILQAKQQEALTELTALSPTSLNAPSTSDEVKNEWLTIGDNLADSNAYDADWWAENQDAVTEAWTAWQAG